MAWEDRRPREVSIRCVVDGADVTFTTWTDMSALLALRLDAKLDRPDRGCEAGTCGTCESDVDGVATRLCQLPARSLDGAFVTTVTAAQPS